MKSLFKKIFDHRFAIVACVLIAVLNKSIIAWLYTDLTGDKSIYLLFAESFLKTGVLAEPVNIVETGAAVYVYNPAVFSPLYALLCVPFLWLTHSFFVTQFIISVAGWFIFFTALYKIGKLLFKDRWQVNLFVVSCSFFIYPHELASAPKDTLAAAFTLWSILFLYRFLQADSHWKNAVFLGLSIVCLCLIKLLYLPLALILLALLFVFIVSSKNKGLLTRYFWLLASVLLMGIIIYGLFIHPAQNLGASNQFSLPNDGTSFVGGFYPQNLLHTYPFITSSIINTTFLGVQIEKATQLSFTQLITYFRLIDAFLLIALLFLFFGHFKKMVAKKILFNTIALSLTMIGIIFFLSLTSQAFSYKSSEGLWTYVADARSFLVPMIALQLLLFLYIFSADPMTAFRKALLFLFLFNCVHGIYFTAKRVANANGVMLAGQTNNAIKKLTSLVPKNAGGKQVGIVTSDAYLRRYAVLQGISSFSFTSLAADLSWIKKGSSFVIATHLEDSALLKKLPEHSLKPLDTVHPFVVHFYETK